MFQVITISVAGGDTQKKQKKSVENKDVIKTEINTPTINFDLPPAVYQDDPPKEVIAKYSEDLNILKIHDAIRIIIGHKLATIPKLKAEIIKLNTQITSGNLNYVDINNNKNMIDKYKQNIYELESGNLWNSYVQNAKPLLLEYLTVAGDEIKGIITIQINKKNEEDRGKVSKRLNIIYQYILIAEKYIDLNLHFITPQIKNCPICDELLSNLVENEEGILICKCGYEKIIIYNNQTSDEYRLDNGGVKSNYNDLTSFLKRMDAFEGKQDYKLPKELFIQLDKYFISKDLPSADEIKISPLLPNGKKDKTSIKLLIEGLYATNNTAYYKDLELIAHELWGWKLGCLDDYREGMEKDYKDTQAVYEEIKERDSSLNINLRFFWHLSARKYPCEYEDFKSIVSENSLDYHIRMFKEMCRRTGVKYTPI